MKEKLMQEFQKRFGSEGEIRSYFSPGRVNLIGEHTDYNGGHVFPCALTIGTYGIVRKREDDKLRFYSMNFEENGIIETSLKDLVWKEAAGWTNYPKGMMWAMREKGHLFTHGIDLLIYGNIPNGSGLSSSASLALLTGVMVSEMSGLDISPIDLALYGQYAENNFNKVNCGIMDQFAVAMGKKDHAIYLDTNTLEYEYAPVQLDGMKIVIACSNKKRGLADSKYNERRAQSEAALADLQKTLDIKTLGDLSGGEFEQHKDKITDPVNRKRAKHAVYENERTKKAVEILKQGNIREFGRLMKEAHISMRDDYEATGIELDTLVEAAWDCEGVVGARMTGGGFGGCTVNIVEDSSIVQFQEQVGKKYKEKIGYAADFYVVEIGDGTRRI